MSQEMKTAPAAENKMGTMPIGKLLFNMSLPMKISMLVQALYNIVESIFVSKLSYCRFTCLPFADALNRCCNWYRRRYECIAFQSTW